MVAIAAIRAGDDSGNVDHTTASPAPTPARPDRLGNQRYRMTLPVVWSDGGQSNEGLVPAGNGFVVAEPRGITAYDGATGAARWHYPRNNITDDGRSGVTLVYKSLLALDDGSVVLAQWRGLGWIAFDASTGEILWRDSEFTRDVDAASDRPQVVWARPWFASVPLATRGADGIRRYDPRTGARLWTVDTFPRGCGNSNHLEIAANARAIYRVTDCSDDTGAWAVATAFDLRTGAVIGTRELMRVPGAGRREVWAFVRGLSNTVVIDWSSHDDTGQILVSDPNQLATTPVWRDGDRSAIAADPEGADVLMRGPWSPPGQDLPRFTVVDLVNGAEKYALPGMDADGRESADFLANQIVDVQDSDSNAVRAWSRVDGRAVDSRVIEPGCGLARVLTAPGAVVVLCFNETSTELIGYAAG